MIGPLLSVNDGINNKHSVGLHADNIILLSPWHTYDVSCTYNYDI